MGLLVIDAFRVEYPIKHPWSLEIASRHFASLADVDAFVADTMSMVRLPQFSSSKLMKHEFKVSAIALLSVSTQGGGAKLYNLGEQIYLHSQPLIAAPHVNHVEENLLPEKGFNDRR